MFDDVKKHVITIDFYIPLCYYTEYVQICYRVDDILGLFTLILFPYLLR